MSQQQPDDENLSGSMGLISWFAGNHVAANILMMLFLVAGLFSVMSMRSETFPQIDPRTVVVSVTYPGATPYEIEDAITSRVEDSLVGITGVKRITSTASEGYGYVTVEMEDFADADDVYSDVETNVNALSDFPPENAERPTITKTKLTPNVMNLALHGEVSEHVLRYWGETIEDELRLVDGVANTSLSGIRDYQISVEVSEDALRKYNLTLNDISNAIESYSTDIPAGTVESRQGDILLRIQEKRYNAAEFENIPLRSLPSGATLKIKDVGTVIDGFTEGNIVSKFNGERAAFISINRAETADTIAVASGVKEYIETVKLPKGLHLTIQQDRTEVLVDRINLMLRNAVLGFMLVFLVLLLFLDLKLAFWTSVAIPVSFLGGMMIIHAMGYSLNMISLFALIVVLGIVVDDAIIMGESIFNAQRREPDNPHAMMKGVKTVLAPVTVGVTTTMAAFAPLIFSTGTIGQIIGIIPIVVIPILFISLMEAFFILPAHLSHPTRWSRGIMATTRDKFTSALERFTERRLMPLADLCMSWRYATLAFFIAIAIVTGGMFASGTVRFVFFPAIEGDEISINVTMPEGTPFATTEETMLEIEQEIIGIRDRLEGDHGEIFKSIFTSIGQTTRDMGPGSGGGGNAANRLGQVKITLVSSDFRDQSASDIEGMIREKISHIAGIEELNINSSLVQTDPEIDVELSHPDDEILQEAVADLKRSLTQIAGTKDVSDSFEPGKTEYVFELTPEGKAVGLTPAELGRQLRNAFFGREAQRFQRGRSEIIVYVRYPEGQREDISMLRNARIRLSDGREVPLSSVANIKTQRGYSRIESVDGRRVLSVTSEVDNEKTTAGDIINVLDETILPALRDKYTGLNARYAGETESRADDMKSLGTNMMIALMLIYVLLGTQLRSYVQPILIMTAIPFGVIGATWGHFLLGHDMTFISLFGIVALTGVVVNDSVVLVDYLNRKRAEGLSPHDAALAAIQRRFRPILLTTMTTALGLLPILLETSLQAQFLIPMVISLAMGILFSTFIILLLVPCLMVIFEDTQRLATKYKNRAVKKTEQIIP